MKKIFITIILMLFLQNKTYSQQETLVTQFNYQMSLFNPAGLIFDDESKLAIIHRRQTNNIPLSPITTSLTYGLNIGENAAIGISIIKDQFFIEDNSFVSIDYSYKLKLDDKTDLYLGLKAGGNFYSINTLDLNTYNYSSDPSLSSFSEFMPNIGAGLIIKKNDFYFSFSIPRMLSTKKIKESQNKVTTVKDEPHFYTALGYNFLLDESQNIKLKSNVLMRNVSGAPSTFDYNAMFSFNDNFDLGMVFRTGKNYAALAQFKISKELLFGWSYEINRSANFPILSESGNTLEFLLSYKFL
ncbi:PorP/SprF family type IX secretion system membrane protein [Flavobacteriaceae bacterium]|nr:PorP/SprF family type IX secretion system membrane protein [Flavobacteriaceae bacterium]